MTPVTLSGPQLRALSPRGWSAWAGLLWCLALFCGAAWFGHDLGGEAGRTLWATGWGIAAASWWGLLAPMACAMPWAVLRAGLPGARRLWLIGVLAHLLCSVGLPLLVLLAWRPAGADLAALAEALASGAAFALLALQLPAVSVGLAFLGLSLWQPWLAAWPAGLPALLAAAAACGVARALARWPQAWRSRRWLQPLATELILPLRGWIGEGPLAAPRVLQAGRVLPAGERLACMLGPAFQTLASTHGFGGRWGGYLIALAWCAAVFWWETEAPWPKISWAGVLYMLALAGQPALQVARLRRARGACMGELLLSPGLAVDRVDLLHGVCRATLRVMAERIGLLALALAVLSGARLPGWLPWLAGWVLLLPPAALLMVLWAWAGRPAGWRHALLAVLGLFGAAGGGYVLMARQPVAWPLAGVCALVAAGLAGWAWRSLRGQVRDASMRAAWV